ncbi:MULTISPECIES: LpxI family protein [Hyphobacterium]|uniref:LpxI family protein n=1 Tax=Hyphobacterium vulgare TaxID=1736751 RepID=A0ABV6ZT15_9PROT
MPETAHRWTRLGVIAGGGQLPLSVAEAERSGGHPPFVLQVDGFADADFSGFDTVSVPVTSIGRAQKHLKQAGCDAVCFAGVVKRPDLSALTGLDATSAMLLPAFLRAAKQGDDALLRVLLGSFENKGFRVVGADDVMQAATPDAGTLGTIEPSEDDIADARKAISIAHTIGALDVGQGAVVCRGLVLAVEAQEGTDAMLARVASLPEEIRGNGKARRGVLAKAPKPVQERRIDLPVVGVKTIEGAAAAGLAGIAVEAGGALLVDREATLRAADAAGLFLIAVSVDGE